MFNLKKKQNKKQVVGVFPMAADLLHAGHVNALEEARRHCDRLIVLLNCMPTKGVVGKRSPYQSVFERYWQIRAVKWVDDVIPYECDADLKTCLGCLKYDIRFLGDDYRNKTWTGKEMEDVRGIKPYFTEREHHKLSTTELVNRVQTPRA